MQDLTPGQSIAQRFKLTRRLEPEPGFECWLAEDASSDTPAVLRFATRRSHAEVSAEARRELQRVSHLVHPNIVPFLGLFQHGGRAVCAHAFAGSRDLRDWSGLDARKALEGLLPVMSALGYLHDLGVVHGRLDARAVRLTDDGKALLDATGASAILSADDALPTLRGDLRAFGALLVRVAGIESGSPAPEALNELFGAMQSGDEQVPDIHSARRQIARVLQLEGEPEAGAVLAGGAVAGPVTARKRSARPDDRSVQGRQTRSRPSVPMLFAAPALVAVLALAVVVVFFLPRPELAAPTRAAEAARTTSPARTGGQQQSSEPAVAPFAAAETAKVRQDAQDAAMSLLRSLVALEERHAETWAAEEFAAARLAGDDGDAIYRRQEFASALERYKEGLALAESLIARSGEVLNTALEEGEAALQAGNVAESRRQFELALMIDEDHPDARSGMQRAEALAEVVTLMAAGEEQEQAGQLSEARESYRKAAAIDPAFAAAGESLARVNGKIGSERFQQAMSRGFAELNRQNIQGARIAFEQAAKMRPDAAGPKDALAQLGLAQRNKEISDRQESARAAEQQEQWRRAEAEYRAALEADNTLVFARDGLERARQRAELSERMALLIAEPLRMYSNDVYNEARSMLGQARLIKDAGPRLREQISALSEQVALAREPVAVRLSSDGQTTVTIYKVGDLGRFQQRTVGLIPGRYTAVGTRAGFRDVRQEFVVQANSGSQQLTVICEDRV